MTPEAEAAHPTCSECGVPIAEHPDTDACAIEQEAEAAHREPDSGLTHAEAMNAIFERFFRRSFEAGYSFAEFKSDALTILEAAEREAAHRDNRDLRAVLERIERLASDWNNPTPSAGFAAIQTVAQRALAAEPIAASSDFRAGVAAEVAENARLGLASADAALAAEPIAASSRLEIDPQLLTDAINVVWKTQPGLSYGGFVYGETGAAVVREYQRRAAERLRATPEPEG